MTCYKDCFMASEATKALGLSTAAVYGWDKRCIVKMQGATCVRVKYIPGKYQDKVRKKCTDLEFLRTASYLSDCLGVSSNYFATSSAFKDKRIKVEHFVLFELNKELKELMERGTYLKLIVSKNDEDNQYYPNRIKWMGREIGYSHGF